MCAIAPPPEPDPSPQPLPPLPLLLRLLVMILGWLLILVGIAGLALPGIQGCVTIALGAALLSLASELIYRWLRKLLYRWPRIWNRVESLRAWVHGRLTRKRGSDSDAAGEAASSGPSSAPGDRTDPDGGAVSTPSREPTSPSGDDS